MYKFIPEDRQSEGTDSTGYPPWLYGLGKIYLQRKRAQGEEPYVEGRGNPADIGSQGNRQNLRDSRTAARRFVVDPSFQ